jgi:class 3 adenylate cyclase/tetratricopeptide (TPR) repeat protein
MLEGQLRRYLPDQLAGPLLHQPSLTTAHPCATHLDALLHAVSTYLPRYLVGEQLRDPQPGRVSGQFREATIMFADISGFTAMSERLSKHGEKGAEKITNIVGDYFTTMLEVTASQGGDLLKFGGDALLVAFFGADHAIDACRAGAQMQEAIVRFSQVEAFGETFSLRMTVGLGSGLLFTANLGTPEKMEYTVMGEALANMAQAENQAEGGEIFIDEATYQAVQAHISAGERRNGCYLVTHVVGDENSDSHSPTPMVFPQQREDDTSNLTSMVARIEQTLTYLDALVPFLPPGLLDLLRFDPARMASRERGEFRPVTTTFANFYGIEEIIRQLGPEKAAETTAILNAHFSRMHEIIHRYEGVVDKVDSYVVGHRIMALFGAPRAHIDDPERAVRAAWEMQAAMAAFNELETSAGVFTLKQRIGINTGRVFAGNVGSDTRHEYSVMGDEVNLTARLMSVAQESQILISQSTATQVGKRFRLREKAPVKVKGKSLPVPNYEVRGIVERYEAGRPTRRSPLVGRNEEWQTIWRVAQRAAGMEAQHGHFQVLDIHGEMGMGKSRIIEELIEQWTQRGNAAFFSACLSYGRHIPYAPWITILRQVFGLREDDPEQELREKITARLAAANPEWLDWAALVANLLGVSMPESDLLRALDPKLRQQNLRRIIASLIRSESEYRPTLLIIDDVQWIDEASLALLNYLTTRAGSRPSSAKLKNPLLVCIAYRPEEPVDLTATRQSNCTQSNYTVVPLEPLSEKGSLALLDSQLPTDPEMPQQLKSVILKNAQGNPLFIVEMAHALIDNYLRYDAENRVYRARTDLDVVQVPDTVSRVILSRLDRLDEQSRNMLKVASVIGRAFQQWLLHSIYPYRLEKTEMETRLLDLCKREILDSSELFYLFRHVMTREVAYESLLYAERRDLHCKIAQSIEAQRGTHLDEYVEVLAQHYTLAEERPQALKYQLKAGRRAQAIYANEDAIHRYQQALEIAPNTPSSLPERLAAYEGLGDTYHLVGRYDEALQSYAQARAIADEMDSLAPGPSSPDTRRHRADLCRKTGRVYEYRGEYGKAMEWVEQGLQLLRSEECIEIAQLSLGGAAVFHREGRFQDTLRWCHRSLAVAKRLGTEKAQKAAAHAYYLLGYSYHRLGEMEKASLHYQRSLDTYQALEDRPGMARAQNNLANLYFDQDDWSRATAHYQQALATLERIGDLYGQAVIANNLGGVLANRGKMESARASYQRGLEIATELGIWGLAALLHNNLGYTYVRTQEWDQGLEYLRQSLKIFQQIGAEEFLPELYRNLAEAHLGQGELDGAVEWAEMSLESALTAEGKMEEGRTRCVLGSVYQAQGHFDRAEAQLQRSLHILESLESPYEVARTEFQLAALYTDQGDEARSTHLGPKAIATFERLGAELDLAQATESWGGFPSP